MRKLRWFKEKELQQFKDFLFLRDNKHYDIDELLYMYETNPAKLQDDYLQFELTYTAHKKVREQELKKQRDFTAFPETTPSE